VLGLWGGVGGPGRAASCPGGPCAPPGVRFTNPSDAVAAGAAGRAVSKGLRSFMLEFTLL